MMYLTNSHICFHVVESSKGHFKVVREEYEEHKDVFNGTFKQCSDYCENKVREIDRALIF